MPVFTAGAAAIATAIGFTAGTTGFIIAQSLIAAGLAAGTGHLLGVFDDGGGLPPIEDPGVEQRLGANTQNRVPVLYGEFMQRGALTYAEITEDRKTLYAVITLGETSGGISISKIYWDDVLLTIAGTGEVTGGVDVEGNAVTRFNGNLNIVTYPNGGRSVYLETLVDDWTSNHKMTGLAYAVVTVRYNRDEDVTNLSDIRFIGNAPINNPAEAVIDQLTNTRYGLGLPTSVIDTDSFNAAKAYYETTLPFTDAAGNAQTAERFQINGSLNSADPVFERIEAILLGSNSSLRWQGGKYSIFVNKADTVEAFTMNESRVVGDIQVSEVGLNSVVNSVEVQYGRDANNNYQRNIVTVDLPTANRYPNELDRVRSIDLPLVRTFVEAERIAYILLNQSREQLSIKHMATIEAMPLEAGDVITYTLPNYGWDQKQFRITRVSEMEVEDGLQYQIEAVEYAASVYTDRTHVEPGASPNTNIPQPGQLAAVNDLAISSTFPDNASPHFILQWTVPTGLYERFDVFVNEFKAPFTSATTTFIKSVYPTAASYTSGNIITDAIYGLPAGSYNIWVVGRNSIASSASSNTAVLNGWAPMISSEGLGPDVGIVAIRLHENIATMDPGAPTGAEGLGGDWYDPSGEYGTVPTDPDPHWEARGVGEVVPGINRVVDFSFTGISGAQEDSIVDTAQIIDFEGGGVPAARSITQQGQQEITQFTFSGDTTDTGGEGSAQWRLGFSGSSDATVGTSISEEFYIYLAGNSASANIAQELFINSVGTSAVGGGGQTFNFGTLLGTVSSSPGAGTILAQTFTVPAPGSSSVIITFATAQAALDFARALSTNVPNTTNIPVQTGAPSYASTTDFTLNSDGTDYTFTQTSSSMVRIYEEQNFFNAGTGVYAVQAFGYVRNGYGTADGTSYAVTVSTGAVPSEVNVQIGSIDETFVYADGLTGAALRDNLLASIQASTAITALFTVTAANAPSGITGVITGSPIIELTAIDDTATYTITTVFTGDELDGSSSGVLVANQTFTQSTVQISIPTESINEVFTLASALTGSTALRNSLLTSVQANAAITDEFTVTADVASNITGVTDGEPIVKLVANDTTDHSIGVTFTDGNGDLTGSAFGSIVEGSGTTVTTEIRVTYDSDLIPSFQDIAIGAAADGSAIATVVANMIDGHGELSATKSSVTQPETFTLIKPTNSTTNGGLWGTADIFVDNVLFDYRGGNVTVVDFVNAASIGSTIKAEGNIFSAETTAFLETGSNFLLQLFTDPHGSGRPQLIVRPISLIDNTLLLEIIGFINSYSLSDDAGEVYDSLFEFDVSSYGDELLTGISYFKSGGNNPDTSHYYVGDSFALSESLIGYVDVTVDEPGPFDPPVISIIQMGTTDAFSFGVETTAVGFNMVGSRSTYDITLEGTSVASGTFGDGLTSVEASSFISGIINGLTTHTATSNASSITTATSVDDISQTLAMTVTNPSGSTGGTLSVTRVLNQAGQPEISMGTDDTLNLQIGTEVISTLNIGNMTVAQILDAVNTAFTTDGRFTGVRTSSTLRLTATFDGPANVANVSLIPGMNSDGSLGTFTIPRTIISDGEIVTVTAGGDSTYTITIGDTTLVSARALPEASGPSAIATQIALDLSGLSEQYSFAAAAGTLTATSTFFNTLPDVTITVVPGKNLDDTAATLAVSKNVVTPGAEAGFTFANAVWSYYVINQEVRVDDDTVMMEADNSLQVRRGLILNTETYDQDGGTNDIAILTDSYTTSTLASTILFTGNAVFKVSQFDSNTNYSGDRIGVQFNVETSLDGSTWNFVGASFALSVGRPSNPESGRYAEAIPFAVIGSNSAGSETVHIRVTRRWTRTTTGGTVTNIAPPAEAAQGEFLVQTLLLEELVVS